MPPPGDVEALQRYVEQRMSVPFDRAHPLWEMTLVDGYGGSGCALVTRFHHSLADGVALSQVLLSSAKNGKDTVVVISADASAKHQAVITVMEAARRSGLTQITFATQSAAQAASK